MVEVVEHILDWSSPDSQAAWVEDTPHTLLGRVGVEDKLHTPLGEEDKLQNPLGEEVEDSLRVEDKEGHILKITKEEINIA